MASDPMEKKWRQYERDLICVIEKYPVIYSWKVKKSYSNFRRLTMAVGKAWIEVAAKLAHYPFRFHKSTWRYICYYYYNKHILCRPNDGGPNDMIKDVSDPLDKYTCGLLNFIDREYNTETIGVYKKVLLKRKNTAVRDHKIRDTMAHLNPSTDEPRLWKNKLPKADIILTDAPSPSQGTKSWTEDELLNATRLTQEMILELIRIKSANGE